MKTIVVALGGNAILKRGQKGTSSEQFANVTETAKEIVALAKEGYRVLVTHGNGPQVGNILIQNEKAENEVPGMPMDVCGSQSQGFIGYMMQMSIRNEFIKQGIDCPVTTIITQTVVDKDDQAFANPTKPVGPFKDRAYAELRVRDYNETWIEDSGRGWRRVVPSPAPLRIVETQSIKTLMANGHLVVSTGGGGIPVIQEEDGSFRGVEAVVDKDLSAERLAMAVGADTLLILTDVPGAAVNFNGEKEIYLGEVSYRDLMKFSMGDHFKTGSMAPKVQAVLRFVKSGGERGIIASLGNGMAAVRGEKGTIVRRATLSRKGVS